VPVSPARSGADAYLEVGFSEGSLAAGAATGDIQLRFAKSDWSPLDESDDYSHGPGGSYADAPRVTAYVDGRLAWGTEPR
jgi:cellulose 1,4-beta-cellobiosidase